MLKRFINEAKSNPQIASGLKQRLGITSQIATQAPIGMATRPPTIANKERGTMSSATRMIAPRLYL